MTLSKFIEKIQSYPDCEKYTSAIGKNVIELMGIIIGSFYNVQN
jgi:hypothetical protein